LGVGGVFKGWSTAAIPAATALANLNTFTRGVSGFFKPNPWAAWGMHAALGVDQAGFYSTAPLRKTLGELVDFDAINAKRMRLTLGAVNVSSGDMRYFDSRDETLGPEHVMASGALPPAFPAVRIGGASYWDGGIYSNTPIEAVLDDKPRRDSLIFSANMWQPTDAEPETLANVLARQKDIQYASRANSHIARQQQIHRLRHIIRGLAAHITPEERGNPAVRELLAYGCATVMHVVPLLAPKIKGEDQSKDIDFTPAGVRTRWRAGYEDMQRRLDEACWQNAFDAIDGVIVHDAPARTGGATD
jgi:NTE family protein